MKFTLTFFAFLFIGFAFAQNANGNYKQKTVAVTQEILIDSVSINAKDFKVTLKDSTIIDTTYYNVDFSKALLKLKKPIAADSIHISYLKYPDFLTKTYKQFDDAVIVENNNKLNKIYRISQPNTTNTFTPFDGLTTSGSISRGITIGNNQNSVLNSELDLQITGKLSETVSLRASIQDANIPLQESGYSQRLDEFDQVFVEIFSDRWNVRAGDIDLENSNSYFSAFSKRVQGLSLKANLGKESQTNLFAAGAIVRGQFTTSQFTAQEGNQGPYKLQGPNGELFVLIVSGSETVYVNGIAIKRGESEDYIIDYNAGEIIFNSTFPITSEMRITVDYQFSDRNYSRIVTYGGGNYTSEKFSIGASVYSENDSKNNPLQQNLSPEQVEILSEAGDDRSQMVAPSSVEEAYNENRILYRKIIIGGEEVFEYSNNPDDTLFNVRFTNVGESQGNYTISSINAINTIYEYVAPVLGVPQGNFEPIVQLVAPVKLQVAVVNGTYTPTEKTQLNFELAGSKNDLNLFSNLDDNNNDGFAAKLNIKQNIIKQDSLWNVNAFVDTDFIQQEFRNIEGLYNVEFNRDWNIDANTTTGLNSNFGDQLLFSAGTNAFHDKKGNTNYLYEHLNFSQDFTGNRHSINANLFLNEKLWINTNSSILKAEATLSNSTFFRTYNTLRYSFGKPWIGGRFSAENNKQTDNATQQLTDLSQKFTAYEAFTGIGDSTNVFVEVGYKYRVNDSIRNNELKRVNNSNTYYLDSRLIKNAKTNLSLFVNYRKLNSKDESIENEQSLNSRLVYNQQLFKNFVQWNTVFETNSGSLPQQDFTYVEVEPGQGAYTWNDYNNNGIQEIEEFEIAQFQDQGQYIRVLLPNQIFIKTHQNRLSQSITVNPGEWQNSDNKTKKFWSHFYNQSSYLVDRKLKRDGNNFNLNPFENDEVNQLGLQLNFRNVLFFNRGKQHYTTSYTYLNNESRNVLSFLSNTGNPEDVSFVVNTLKSHQFNFNHKFAESWLINFLSSFDTNETFSNNFVSRNFKIDEERFNPKLSYLLNDKIRFDVFYQYSNKANTIGGLETLEQQKYGLSFSINANVKSAISGEFNVFSNTFEGNANSPVGYQMLEGLQPGKNLTWTLLAQQKITKYLDLNLNYFGRKTETSNTIHTGTVQLKAYF
ncbi:hypothetical protein [Lacinutrix sp. MedPE-SW]|uniref:hypothetical protein n=1 Tax=Lacinutrix sp. MedPE-SW TaxID=1860087 RepID=UPI0009180398|nr:hypothetical protein [Lacinutrix sp. MedPE-SW]OIQ23668.1 MAG: hypothetical protein BM549_03635 [Lacinutrix sp. MedPE-SW]